MRLMQIMHNDRIIKATPMKIEFEHSNVNINRPYKHFSGRFLRHLRVSQKEQYYTSNSLIINDI
jgi:hypothetical protein